MRVPIGPYSVSYLIFSRTNFASFMNVKWYLSMLNVEVTHIPLWSWVPSLWLVAIGSP